LASRGTHLDYIEETAVESEMDDSISGLSVRGENAPAPLI